MSEEVKIKIDLDHFKTIEELERDLIVWIKEDDIYSFDRYLNEEDVLKIVQLLIKKENIIEEIREYATGDLRLYDNESIEFEISNKLLKILDKGEDK